MIRQIIVNEKDEIIGYKEHRLVTPGDLYRVSILWITNSKEQILLSQRSLNKFHDPGKWGPAVTGTVEEGETYLTNIIKETREEIGLEISESDLKAGPKLYLDKAPGWKFFSQVFFYKTNMDITELNLQRKEVIQLKWYTKDELAQLFKGNSGIFVYNLDTLFNACI